MTLILRELKFIFLIHFVVNLILGLIFFLIPELYIHYFSWPYLDPIMNRLLGSLLLGLAVSSIICYGQTEWERVKITVEMEIVSLALAVVALIWGLIIGAPPAVIIMNLIVEILLLTAFSYLYFKQQF